MDPRPYHYEFRRLRLNNPTYQSVNLYQSLYHRGLINRYDITNNRSVSIGSRNVFQKQLQQYSNYFKHSPMKKTSSFQIQSIQPRSDKLSNSMIFNRKNPQTSRSYSNRSNQQKNEKAIQEKPSVLASYGQSSMLDNFDSNTNNTKGINKNQHIPFDYLNRFSIYQKQQKPYNIIGNYPRHTSTQLRKYPKMTLENKLIEEGRFKPVK